MQTNHSSQPDASKVVFEQQFEGYFLDKAPFQIPVHIKEAIVKYIPWVNLALMLLLLPALLFLLGIGTLFVPAGFMGGIGNGFGYMLTMVLSIGLLALRVLALPGLFARKRSAWILTYYGNLINVLLNIISFSLLGLLFDMFFLFVLFQIRSYYK